MPRTQDHTTDFFDNHGSPTQLTDTRQIPGWEYPVPPIWDNTTVSKHQIVWAPTAIHHAMPGAYPEPILQRFYAPTYLSVSPDIASMPSSTEITSRQNTPELQCSDEEFALITADIIASGLRLREQREREATTVTCKRPSLPTPGLDAGPSRWKVERGAPGVASQGDAKHMSKKRRIMDSEQTGVRLAAPMGLTQELPVRGTPTQTEERSKHGQRGLNMEILLAQPQGVSPLFALGPDISGETPGSQDNASQAWTAGGSRSDIEEAVGIEDAHDEEESDRERWDRLMLYMDDKWMCMGCEGRVFSDRCTLQRHCRSSAHQKERDWRRCWLCPKKYLRQSNLNRHVDTKHPGQRAEGGGL